MSSKIKKVSKILIIICLLPLVLTCISYSLEFLMQLGRIIGTLIKIIMNLE